MHDVGCQEKRLRAEAVKASDYNLERDIFLSIPAGRVPYAGVVNKFGANVSSAAGAVEYVWDGGGTYTFPTTATITHVRSAVDSATTQGLVIELQGLDANWNLTVQSATLDGTNSTTEVLLTTALIRIFRIKVTDSAIADQNIWAGATGMAAVTAKAIVTAGNNQTLMAIYTVPAGKTAYITQYYYDYVRDAVRDPDSINFRLWVQDNAKGYEPQLKHEKGIPKQGSPAPHPFKPYFKVTQKSDIYITAAPDAADAYVHAGFDLILLDN